MRRFAPAALLLALAAGATAPLTCSRKSPDDAQRSDGGPGDPDTAPATPPGPRASPTGIRVVDIHEHWDPRYPSLILQRLDEAGIAVAFNYSGGSPRAVSYSVEGLASSGGRLQFFCTIPWGAIDHPQFVEAVVDFLRQCRQAGGKGLKISKALGLAVPDPSGTGLLPVDAPLLDPIFEEAGVLGMPVAIHAGDPQAFFQPCVEGNERYEELSLAPDWCFADRTQFPAWEDIFGAFVRRVARHPRTTFIGVHFGNDPEEPTRVAEVLRQHPNLVIDTAARLPEIGRRPPDELRPIFLEFSDRILFGTDLQVGPEALVLGAGPETPTDPEIDQFWKSTWRFFETEARDLPSPTPIQGRWAISGVNLPRDVLEKIYHRNAERLVGL